MESSRIALLFQWQACKHLWPHHNHRLFLRRCRLVSMSKTTSKLESVAWTLVTVLLAGVLGSTLYANEVTLNAELLWRYDEADSGCEIACYDPVHARLFVTVADGVSLLDARSGKRVALLPAPAGYHATSVACNDNHLAVAWAAQERTNRGMVAIYAIASDSDQPMRELRRFPVGALPDMVVFSPDGRWLLTANEGEPSDDYTIDPEGSISAIDLSRGIRGAEVHQLSFKRFNNQREELRAAGVRIFGRSIIHADRQATVAEDLEPEYIAISADSNRAWVSLQENNAVAEIDLAQPEIIAIHPLGLRDFAASASGNHGFDASDADGGARIRPWPVSGMYQPDSIGTVHSEGRDYVVTVNEGDPRKYTAFYECWSIEKLSGLGLQLDEHLLKNLSLQQSQLSLLQVSTASGDGDGDGDLDRLCCFGTRSFSVFRSNAGSPLELVYDSGDDFERITSQEDPDRYNADSVPNSAPDVQSPKRGPEPEGLAIGQIGPKRVAAIGLERNGGVMLYDIDSPTNPRFLKLLTAYRNEGDMDCAPEGLLLITDSESPLGKAMLVVCYEKSHTVTAYCLEWER